MSWRDYARPIIAKVIKENKGKTEKEIRAALSAVYPFGQRKYHPYKIWLSEIKEQLHPSPKYRKIIKKPQPINDNQQELF